MLVHSNLATYYQTVFALVQHHKYQISEIEDIYPFERDIYFSLLVEFIKEIEEKNKGK